MSNSDTGQRYVKSAECHRKAICRTPNRSRSEGSHDRYHLDLGKRNRGSSRPRIED